MNDNLQIALRDESNILKSVVSVYDLKHGDTVELDGKLETVSRNHLGHGFMGYTYKGDTHRNGIVKIVFKVPTASGFCYA